MIDLTPEQIAEGWKPWAGGPCPVPLESKPAVMFADKTKEDRHNLTASFWAQADDWWQHEGDDPTAFIIAYKEEPKP